MIDQHSVHEGGRDYGAFIPSLIDDYGFDPYEYRIYCRLERRIGKGDAACFESIPNMAKACKMSRQKVRDALQVLVLTGFAKQEKQVGKTDRYILMPREHWVDSHHLDEIRQQVTAYRQQSDAKTVAKHNQLISTELQRSHLPNYDVVDTELQRSHKGSPIKVSNEGIQLRFTPLTPQQGNECVGNENLSPQPGEPRTGIQPPRELLDITGQPLNPTTVGMRDVNDDEGCPVMSSDIVTPSLATISNQPDSQLQPFNPHEEQRPLLSLIGNTAMELEGVGKNELELETLQECRQNFLPAIFQRDEAVNAITNRETSTEDEYFAPAALEAKIAATQTNPPTVLSHHPEPSRVEPNIFGRDENSAVLPLNMGAAIETSPTTPNPSQHQAPARLQADSRFHPRSVARRDQENCFDHNQSDFPKNLDGSLSLPWDTNKRGTFDTQFENHMARSLMKYPAYCDLMAGELITKVRKHISAGRYDLKRRDELLIEWEAMHDPTRNDFW